MNVKQMKMEKEKYSRKRNLGVICKEKTPADIRRRLFMGNYHFI